MNKIDDKKFLPIVATIESQIISIEDRLDTVKHGYEIGKVGHKNYVKALELAKHDFYLLLDKKPTPIERSLIKKSSTYCHELLEKSKNQKWRTVGRIGLGILTLGISIAIGVQI